MTIRFATPEEIKNWNAIVSKSGAASTVFSTSEYAEIKKLTAYTPRYIMAEDLAVLALEKKTAPLGRLWYLPKGPNVSSTTEYLGLMAELKKFARSQGVFLIKTEPELPLSEADRLKNAGYTQSNPIIPSQSTITLDISGDLDTVLTAMPQKGRYAIKRAERDGVTVEQVESTDENCQKMYALLADTAKGQFGIRNYNYFKTYWSTFSKAGTGQLFFAYVDGVVVAGAYALYFDKKSIYKDGASVRERTAYGASHLLQWSVISWAKEKGSVLHDLCGSPPSDRVSDKTHPHYNIGLFKTSFNKQITDYIGCYDVPVSGWKYKLWSLGLERVYKKLYYKATKDYYY